jgi:transposase-like protein
VWFTACWLFATGKDGISALSLKRTLEIGSYQTAWAMLHRLRSVLVRPGRERLTGTVEVDETYIGGQEPGLRGGRAKGKKVLTGIAVEIKEPKGYGRCRMAPLVDASGTSLHAFISDHVEPGATVITDGWQGYSGLENLGYGHEPRSQRAARARGENPGELLPAVHRVASLAKRWLLGTHQGSVEDAHLPSYLNEFVFRFNRRHSRSRGMLFYRVLELAIGHAPVRYGDIIAGLHSPEAAKKSRQAAEPRSAASEAAVAYSVRLDGDPSRAYSGRGATVRARGIGTTPSVGESSTCVAKQASVLDPGCGDSQRLGTIGATRLVCGPMLECGTDRRMRNVPHEGQMRNGSSPLLSSCVRSYP